VFKAEIRPQSFNDCEYGCRPDGFRFFILNLGVRKCAIFVVDEDRSIEIEQPLYNLAYSRLVDVRD